MGTPTRHLQRAFSKGAFVNFECCDTADAHSDRFQVVFVA
jgi:hypothetical protein